MIIFVICALILSTQAAIPKNWKTCKSGDNECLKTAIQEAVDDLISGKPSLGVLPLDPLEIGKLVLDKGGNGGVNVKLEFTDLKTEGLKTIKVKSVSGDWKNMYLDLEYDGVNSYCGKYKTTGKVLLLPITGDGNVKIEFYGFKIRMAIKFTEKTINGKTHLYADKVSLPKMEPEKMVMNFENLFHGDKQLGDNMNKVLNENWPEILAEMKPVISDGIGAVFKEISNRVFSKIEKSVIAP